MRTGNGDDVYAQYVPAAIEWCIWHEIDIVCMAFGDGWGIGGCNGWWCDRFEYGTLQGTTWVAATGNNGYTEGVYYPAESHFVIGIGGYDGNPAQRDSASNYGTTYYIWEPYPPYPYLAICEPCINAQGGTEFKPNAYECYCLETWTTLESTSVSTPLACADIAIGIYSRYGGYYTEGYEYLLSVIALCNEFPVSPWESSQQGDVIDTRTLWHRSQESP